MANQGKRMVNENLIALLEAIEAKGITADDIESAVDKHLYQHNISFDEIYNDDNNGYIFIPIIINSNPNPMTLIEILDALRGFEGDYYQ